MESKSKINSIARMINVCKVYNGKSMEQKVLKNISFEAFPGETILLLGPSGSGKTTFLTLLGGMQQPSSGEIFLFNRNTSDYTVRELQYMRARKMGFIFQTFKLLDALTVMENLLIVQKFAKINKKKARQKALFFLEKMQLTHHQNSLPKAISHGEKQRVAIARALINETELIIADEPTGSLNSDQGMKIVKLLQELVISRNCCAVIASHDERITPFADRIIHICDGLLTEG